MRIRSSLAVAVLALGTRAYAGDDDLAVDLGLIQPIVLRGGNVELDYHTRHWSFDYSHGFSLEIGGSTAVGAERAQHLTYHLPFSTGFGIGYRVTRSIDVRIEPKLHSWEVYYDGDPEDAAHRLVAYKTFTLGVGVYDRWLPFARRVDWTRGLTLTASARLWPTVASTLSGGELRYTNRVTGQMETLQPAAIGIANTPIVVNLDIGYTFDL